MSSEIDINKLRRLHAATTQGEWFVVHTDDEMRMNAIYVGTKSHGDSHDNQIGMDGTRSGEIVAATLVQYPNLISHRGEKWDEDAAFIAVAHNAMPALLDELERLRAENAALKGKLNE